MPIEECNCEQALELEIKLARAITAAAKYKCEYYQLKDAYIELMEAIESGVATEHGIKLRETFKQLIKG